MPTGSSTHLNPNERVANRYHNHRNQVASEQISEEKVEISADGVRPLLQAHLDVGSVRKERHQLEVHRPRYHDAQGQQPNADNHSLGALLRYLHLQRPPNREEAAREKQKDW